MQRGRRAVDAVAAAAPTAAAAAAAAAPTTTTTRKRTPAADDSDATDTEGQHRSRRRRRTTTTTTTTAAVDADATDSDATDYDDNDDAAARPTTSTTTAVVSTAAVTAATTAAIPAAPSSTPSLSWTAPSEHTIDVRLSSSTTRVSALLTCGASARALVVLGHGAGSHMRHATVASLSAALARRRIATLRYNQPFAERGRGGLDARATTLACVRAACASGVRLARERRIAHVVAGGHSFSGRMTTHAAAERALDDVAALVCFAFPLHPPQRPASERAEHLYTLPSTLPLLFVRGERDAMCDRTLFAAVLTRLGARASTHTVATGDHSFKTLKRTRTSTEDAFDECARATHEWIERVFGDGA